MNNVYQDNTVFMLDEKSNSPGTLELKQLHARSILIHATGD